MRYFNESLQKLVTNEEAAYFCVLCMLMECSTLVIIVYRHVCMSHNCVSPLKEIEATPSHVLYHPRHYSHPLWLIKKPLFVPWIA